MIYDRVGFFYEGLAYVRMAKKFGYVDRDGQLVIPMKYDRAEDFYNGYATVAVGTKHGVINRHGVTRYTCDL